MTVGIGAQSPQQQFNEIRTSLIKGTDVVIITNVPEHSWAIPMGDTHSLVPNGVGEFLHTLIQVTGCPEIIFHHVFQSFVATLVVLATIDYRFPAVVAETVCTIPISALHYTTFGGYYGKILVLAVRASVFAGELVLLKRFAFAQRVLVCVVSDGACGGHCPVEGKEW